MFDTGEPIRWEYRREPQLSRDMNEDWHNSQFTAHVFDTGESIRWEYRREPQLNGDIDENWGNFEPIARDPWEPEPEAEHFNSRSEPVRSEAVTGDRPLDIVPAKVQGNGHRPGSEASELETASSITPPPADEVSHNGFHAAFGNLSEDLSHATSFDLGTVTVEIPFDEFDRRLDEEAALEQAQSLDDRFDEFDRAIALDFSNTNSEVSATTYKRPITKNCCIFNCEVTYERFQIPQSAVCPRATSDP